MSILSWDTRPTPGKWNAKIVNKKTNRPHVEIRTTRDEQDIIIAVSLCGEMKLQFGAKPTVMCNIRLSSSLPIKMSFDDWEALQKAVKEARQALKKLKEIQ
jgi:hypothetical protein